MNDNWLVEYSVQFIAVFLATVLILRVGIVVIEAQPLRWWRLRGTETWVYLREAPRDIYDSPSFLLDLPKKRVLNKYPKLGYYEWRRER